MSLFQPNTFHLLEADNIPWMVVNDTVMGGRSSSRAQPLEGGLVRFEGKLSLENNGGFASIRSRAFTDLFNSNGEVVFQVRGDGRTYYMNLRMDDRRGAFSYRQPFQTIAGETLVIALPLAGFQPTSFGRPVRAEPLDPNRIQSMGFMLADKKPGGFRLDILSIDTAQAITKPVFTAQDLIALAISRGVPIFNRGDHDACAAIYETAIRGLMLMNSELITSSMSKRMEEALVEMMTVVSDAEKAWVLRRALDDVDMMLRESS